MTLKFLLNNIKILSQMEKNKQFKVIAKTVKLMVRKQKKKIDYIWYCPRKSCGVILMKTQEHFLSGNGIIKCYRCNETLSFKRIMEGNKHNIDKFLKET